MNKSKMGRPKKERTGKQVWIPAECLDVVNAVVAAMKKPQPNQQATQ
jgi:hypothetical protein